VTSLRLLSGHARVDLVGVEHLPEEVTSRVHGVLSQLEVPQSDADPAHDAPRRLCVTEADGVLHVAGDPLPARPDRAAAAVVAILDAALLAESPCLTLHAAVVAGPLGAAVVPGVSGTGKSTLAGACQQIGLLLGSDEAGCLDPDEDVLWPHPRPLGLDRRSRELLGLRPPDEGPLDGEYATAPALLGTAAAVTEAMTPVAVVLPDRQVTTSPSLTLVGKAEALAVLLASCLNTGPSHRWDASRAWTRLTAFVRSVECYRMAYGSPQEGAEILRRLLT